jgi:hypothetical protein
MLKMTKRGRAELRPQRRKTEIVAPIVETRMTVVTWKRSQSMPMIIVENTAAAFKRETSSVPIEEERPREAAKGGR